MSMRFLAFVTSDAECERITALLREAGVAYNQKTVYSDDQHAQGYILAVPAADFDKADELLGTPGHNMSFSLLSDHRAYRDETNERQKRAKRHSSKQLRRFALTAGTVGAAYLIYQIIQNL